MAGRVVVLLAALALGSVLGGCSSGGPSIEATCATRIKFEGRIYEAARLTTRDEGALLAEAGTIDCDDTGGAETSVPPPTIYQLHAVPGYDTRWVVIGKGEGETRLFKAESGELPESIKRLR